MSINFRDKVLQVLDRAMGPRADAAATPADVELESLRQKCDEVFGVGASASLEMAALVQKRAIWEGKHCELAQAKLEECANGLSTAEATQIMKRELKRARLNQEHAKFQVSTQLPTVKAPATATPPAVEFPLAEPLRTATATVPKASQWNLNSLSAFVDSVFGQNVAASIVNRGGVVTYDPADPVADVMHNPHALEQYRLRQTARYNAEVARRRSPECQAEDFDKLRKYCFLAGIKVDGLSYAGIGLRPRGEEKATAAQTKVAQERANEFLAAWNRTTEGALSDHPAAVMARDYIRAEEGEYTIQ